MAMANQDPRGFGAKKIYLDSSNSVMTPSGLQAEIINQGGVPARGAMVQPNMPKSLDDAMYGARSRPKTTLSEPQIAQFTAPVTAGNLAPASSVAAENVAINPPPQEIRAGVRNRNITSQEMAPGRGFVIGNESGRVIPVGNQATESLGIGFRKQGSPQNNATGYGARPIATSTSPAQSQATQLLNQSQELMDANISGPVTTARGQVLDEGSQTVGNGIVARGMLNRAKALTDISNAYQSTEIGMRNSDVNASNIASLIADRTQNNQLQQDQFNLGARKSNLEVSQLEQMDQLKNQYLAETDPAKKEALAAQLSVLTGKTTEKYQPIMGKDEMGNPIYLGAFNARTGEATNQPGTKMGAAGNQAPPQALAMLKANPQLAEQFKAKYGYLPQSY